METSAVQLSHSAVPVVRPSPGSGVGTSRGRDTEFGKILADRLNSRSITLSLHAADRLVRRGVDIDDATADRLNEAFDVAQRKGSQHALFLLDDLAVVAAVPSRSIITALDTRALSNGVFTKIDSAVVMHRTTSEENSENR